MSQEQEQFLKNFIYNNCDRKGTLVITSKWEILTRPPNGISSVRKRNWSSILWTRYIMDNLRRMYWICTVVQFRKKQTNVSIVKTYTLA